jgi:flagellar motor switch protein FliN
VQTESDQKATQSATTMAGKTAFGSIPVTVQVMLGTATLPLAELMQLAPESDIVLDQAAGEAVIVIVNGTRIAKGELYVLEDRGDRLGVRITELMAKAVP